MKVAIRPIEGSFSGTPRNANFGPANMYLGIPPEMITAEAGTVSLTIATDPSLLVGVGTSFTSLGDPTSDAIYVLPGGTYTGAPLRVKTITDDTHIVLKDVLEANIASASYKKADMIFLGPNNSVSIESMGNFLDLKEGTLGDNTSDSVRTSTGHKITGQLTRFGPEIEKRLTNEVINIYDAVTGAFKAQVGVGKLWTLSSEFQSMLTLVKLVGPDTESTDPADTRTYMRALPKSMPKLEYGAATQKTYEVVYECTPNLDVRYTDPVDGIDYPVLYVDGQVTGVNA